MIEMIVTSSTLILATFLLRRLTNGKISMRLRYALWLAAALRQTGVSREEAQALLGRLWDEDEKKEADCP